MSGMMDKNEISRRLRALVKDVQQLITSIEDAPQFISEEVAKDVERKTKENLCFYCNETLNGFAPKDIIRHVHRKCYRIIDNSSQSMEFHVAAGLLGKHGTTGRKPKKDKASEIAEQLGQSIGKLASSKSKKPKP